MEICFLSSYKHTYKISLILSLDPQSLKYLQSGTLQKKSAKLCSRPYSLWLYCLLYYFRTLYLYIYASPTKRWVTLMYKYKPVGRKPTGFTFKYLLNNCWMNAYETLEGREARLSQHSSESFLFQSITTCLSYLRFVL